MTEGIIKFEDWMKVDLRVAEIEKAEDIEGADKLYKLEINVGELGKRILVAGLKENYSKQELIGKKIIVIVNLEPKKLKGIESQGMLLASVSDDKISLIQPDKDIVKGSKIS